MSHPILCTIPATLRRLRSTGVVVLLLAAALAGAPWARPVAAQEPAVDPAAVMSPDVGIPSLSAPAPGYTGTALTDPPTGVPTLRWNPVPEAGKYNIQVSTSQLFGNILIDQLTYATSFTPKTSLPDGTYYWRVRAEEDRLWGFFSETWSFTKDWNATATLKPILVEPAADAPLASFDETVFRWEPVAGAAYYLFEISSAPTFNTDAKDPCYYKANTLIPRHTPTKLLANTTCYWRVTPRDNQENAGVASDIRSFSFVWNRVPALLTPAHNVNLRFLPRFSWQAVEGAKEYILELSTQEDFSSISLAVVTPNTEYTPEENLGNNRDFFWRVKAINPRAVTGPAGETRKFTLEWNQPPTPLTPAPNSIIDIQGIQRIYPYFSWTPIAGAERYHIQISDGAGFKELVGDVTLFNATAYTQPEWKEWMPGKEYEWRVEALDGQGNTTGFSEAIKFSVPFMPPPNLVYPEPYYEPDAVGMPVHTNRTIAHPVFVWDTTHRLIDDPENSAGPEIFEYPDAYELTVGLDRNFDVVSFGMVTAGQAAAPTLDNPFTNLVNGQIYFWKVVPLKGGVPMVGVVPFVWQTRLDTSINQFPATDTPTPMHPRDGFVATGTPPVLGWQPLNGAHHYAVQISREADFDPLVESARPQFVYYMPYQGQLDPMPFGLYYWRFQGRNAADQPVGGWSDARSFIVAADLVTGNVIDYRVPIDTLLGAGEDYDKRWSYVDSSPTVEPAPYDLGDFHMAQDRSLYGNYTWLLAFSVDPGAVGNVTYGVYIDVGHQPGAGGLNDPRGKPITTDPRYRPEYVLYLDRTDTTITKADFRGWQDNQWQGFSILSNVYFDPATGIIQINLPPQSLLPGISGQETSSIAVTVFTTGGGADGIHDSIPDQNGNTIRYPAFLSDMPMPLYPFDTPLSNPFSFHEMPAVRWRMPYFDSTDGYQVQIARDFDFTEIVETWESYESETHGFYGLAPTGFHTKGAMNDEESYYWRVRFRHERYEEDKRDRYDTGPWSPPMRFKLAGYQPGTPTATIAALPEARTTPSFYWERVEGAAGYTIQVDDDANLSSPFINRKIDGSSYTPLDTLADGTYYWRVAMRRSDTVTGQWSPIQTFIKRSLTPALIAPLDGEAIHQQPVFAWTPVITNTGDLRLAAPKYRVQWDDDPNFGSPVTVDTESTAYGLIEGQSLLDGTWHWRVAVIDADNRIGAYSEAAAFYKEYQSPTLIAPAQGSTQDTDVNFEWSPLAGAAEYDIEIADNEAFNLSKKERTDSARYTPTFELERADYYWRVRMRDEDGKTGPFIVGQFTNMETLFLPTLNR
jgi:hypothetical protein